MDVTLETITKENTDFLKSVAEGVFDSDVSFSHLAGYVEQANHILCVAVRDDQVVGQVRAIIHHHPDSPPELYIDNAGVTPALHRQGIAKTLVLEIVRQGRARGCNEIWVGTEADNEPAKALYRSFGLDMTVMTMFDGEL